MADGPWTKFQSTPEATGPWTKFGGGGTAVLDTKENEQEVPDAAKQAHEQLTKKTKMGPETFGVPETSVEDDARINALLKEKQPAIEQFGKDLHTGAMSMIGGGVGGALAGKLVPAAEGAAGGSNLLKFILPLITKSSGVGLGAGAGTLVGGGTPKEALGTAAGVTGMEMGVGATAKVLQPVSKFAKELTKSKVTQLEEAHAAEVKAATEKYELEVSKQKQSVMLAKQKHEQELAEMEKTHKTNVEEHKRAIQQVAQMRDLEAKQAEDAYQQKLTEHKADVAKINADYSKKLSKFKDATSLKAAQEELGKTVGENVKLSEKTIAKKIGGEFDAVNDAVEKKGLQVKVTDATKSARSELYFPDSVKAFNNIMKNVGDNLRSGDFSRIRASYSKLNEILYGGGEMDRDLYQALKTVRNSVGKDLATAAENAGMGERYKGAMKNYQEFMEDFHDTSSIATGGSPISRIIKSEDPAFVVDQFGGKASDRLMKTLEKYKQYGVNTELAGNLKTATAKLKAMSVPKEAPVAPQLPASPKRAPEPMFNEIPRAPQLPMPPASVSIPEPPQAPNIPPFDRDAAKRQELIKVIRKAALGTAGLAGGFGVYELYEKLFGKKPPVLP